MRGHGNAHLVDPSAAFEARGDEPCVGRIDLFYPDTKYRTRYLASVDRAVALCNTCPRQFECLQKAKYRKEINGVWGGRNFDRTEPRHYPGTCPDCGKRSRNLDTHRHLVHRTGT